MAGQKVEVELYETDSGKVPVKEFLDNHDPQLKSKAMELMEWLGKYGVRKMLESDNANQFKGIEKKYGHPLWELKPKQGRILFSRLGGKYVMLHVFLKKTKSTPDKHVIKALKRIKLYLKNET